MIAKLDTKENIDKNNLIQWQLITFIIFVISDYKLTYIYFFLIMIHFYESKYENILIWQQ
jgi:hypothetical protein